MEETNKIKPDKIRIAKLVINTFIFGTALPRTAKEIFIKKFNAMKGAAIRVPRTNTWLTSFTNWPIGFAVKKKDPIGSISKLKMKAFSTS